MIFSQRSQSRIISSYFVFNSRDKNGFFRELMVELLMNCQLNSTLVFLNNTKWVAGKLLQKKKNSFHSPSRSVFFSDSKNLFWQGPEDISNINFSGKMNFSLMKIRILIQMLNRNWITFELKQLQSLSYMTIEPLE